MNNLKSIQSLTALIAGVACIVLGVLVIYNEHTVPYQVIVGVILFAVGVFAIAMAMRGLGFRAQAQYGYKLPVTTFSYTLSYQSLGYPLNLL